MGKEESMQKKEYPNRKGIQTRKTQAIKEYKQERPNFIRQQSDRGKPCPYHIKNISIINHPKTTKKHHQTKKGIEKVSTFLLTLPFMIEILIHFII